MTIPEPTAAQLEKIEDALYLRKNRASQAAWDVIAPMVRGAALEEAALAVDSRSVCDDADHLVAAVTARSAAARIRALKGTP